MEIVEGGGVELGLGSKAFGCRMRVRCEILCEGTKTGQEERGVGGTESWSVVAGHSRGVGVDEA